MPSARRDLNRLKPAVASAVLETIDHIGGAPHRIGKPVRLELEGLWTARRGPYRVVYRIEEEDRLVEIRCSVEKDVVESDEMDSGQELAGFWDQAGDTGTTDDSHQLHPHEC